MRVLLGISGGLDSTYCAHLLGEQGHTVEGAVLKFGDHTDISAAELSCRELGIPLHVIDCSRDFERFVIGDFIENYRNGRTPNPCTVCNRSVKMKHLHDASLDLGFDRYATGHYARCALDPLTGRHYVKKAQDPRKDQSYMLWALTDSQISRLMTPLGELTKDEVRANAASLGLSAAASKESQDICFIPKGTSYVDFITQRIGALPEGNYIDRDGRVIGRHKGILSYTVGQRKGLGASFGKHMFITDISSESHAITLCEERDTYAKGILVGSLNFQRLPEGTEECDLEVKIRYAAKPVLSHVKIEGSSAYVEFSEPIRTPAPGQSAVFYAGEDLMLGSVIEKVIY